MSTKQDYTKQMAHLSEALDGFAAPSSALMNDERLGAFIDAGFGLLGYYQGTTDTDIREDVVTLLVDCAICLGHISNDATNDEATRQRATRTMNTVENLVNALTGAIEENIAARR